MHTHPIILTNRHGTPLLRLDFKDVNVTEEALALGTTNDVVLLFLLNGGWRGVMLQTEAKKKYHPLAHPIQSYRIVTRSVAHAGQCAICRNALPAALHSLVQPTHVLAGAGLTLALAAKQHGARSIHRRESVAPAPAGSV